MPAVILNYNFLSIHKFILILFKKKISSIKKNLVYSFSLAENIQYKFSLFKIKSNNFFHLLKKSFLKRKSIKMLSFLWGLFEINPLQRF